MIAAPTKMSVEALNSGTDGVGVAFSVGRAEGLDSCADAVGVGFDEADAVLTYTFPVSIAVKPLFVIVK